MRATTRVSRIAFCVVQTYTMLLEYYAMITDSRRLRMDALYTLGTSETYKKEVIADNLEGHINSRV